MTPTSVASLMWMTTSAIVQAMLGALFTALRVRWQDGEHDALIRGRAIRRAKPVEGRSLDHRAAPGNALGKQNLSGSVSYLNDDEEKIEEALMRRRFDEWTFRGVSLLFPIVLAMAGWALTLETRLSEVATQQAERGPRIAAIETLVTQLQDAIHDPSPMPETKVEMADLKSEHERLDDRVTRLEERLTLHNYILALPTRPGPYLPPTPSKRGDLRLDIPSSKATGEAGLAVSP